MGQQAQQDRGHLQEHKERNPTPKRHLRAGAGADQHQHGQQRQRNDHIGKRTSRRHQRLPKPTVERVGVDPYRPTRQAKPAHQHKQQRQRDAQQRVAVAQGLRVR